MSRYAAAHAITTGPGDARPTALDIIKDDHLENALSDKVMLITGCSSGIGIETARALAVTGATIYCTVRDLSKGKTALHDILEPGRVELLHVDLDSLDSVRAGTREFLRKSKKLNVLVNNAGIMAIPTLQKTSDGFEAQFGTNHLAHFLLFQLLKPLLLASSSPSFHSRVVNVSSTGHRAGGIQFDNYDFESGNYTPDLGYGQAKTANIYMANEIERRYGAKGLHGLSLHPGGIATGLQTHLPKEVVASMTENETIVKYMKSPEQGAATTVLAAVGKEWEGRGGKYLEECAESKPVEEDWNVLGPGYVPHAYDEEKEGRLWKDSCRMVGVVDD